MESLILPPWTPEAEREPYTPEQREKVMALTASILPTPPRSKEFIRKLRRLEQSFS